MSVHLKMAANNVYIDLELKYKTSYILGSSGSGKTYIHSLASKYDSYAVDKSNDIEVYTYADYAMSTHQPTKEVLDSYVPQHGMPLSISNTIKIVIVDEEDIIGFRRDTIKRDIFMSYYKISPNVYWVFSVRDTVDFVSTNLQAIYYLKQEDCLLQVKYDSDKHFIVQETDKYKANLHFRKTLVPNSKQFPSLVRR